MLIDNGDDQLLLDGFFSRPESGLFSEIAPSAHRVIAGLEALGISTNHCQAFDEACEPFEGNELDAVFAVHGHFDHALDTALVAGITGATLIGEPDAVLIAAATKDYFSVPELKIRLSTFEPPELDETLSIAVGHLNLTLIPTPHIGTPVQGFTGGRIDEHFRFPARRWEMNEGVNSYSVLIESGGETVLIVPSAGSVTDEISQLEIEADLVVLGIGLLGWSNPSQIRDLWRNVVTASSACNVAFVHWDDAKGAITGGEDALNPLGLSRIDQSWHLIRNLAIETSQTILHLPLMGPVSLTELESSECDRS